MEPGAKEVESEEHDSSSGSQSDDAGGVSLEQGLEAFLGINRC